MLLQRKAQTPYHSLQVLHDLSPVYHPTLVLRQFKLPLEAPAFQHYFQMLNTPGYLSFWDCTYAVSCAWNIPTMFQLDLLIFSLDISY